LSQNNSIIGKDWLIRCCCGGDIIKYRPPMEFGFFKIVGFSEKK
jgi:hypothetical protein